MNSDLDDFFGIIITFTLLGLVIMVVIFAGMAAPFIGVGAVPVLAFIYWRNSPQKKEKDARKRTEEMYEQAMALAPRNVETEIATHLFPTDSYYVALALLEEEGFDVPPPVPPYCNSVEGARYRDQLLKYIDNHHDPKRADRFVEAVLDCLPRQEEGTGRFSASRPLTNKEIENLIERFYEHEAFFRKLRRTFDANLEEVNVLPTKYTGDNCAWQYLKGTPLLQLERRQISVDLTNRFEHHMIVGGTGAGKTSMLQYMIHEDLKEDCCVIVIDSQRQMIPKLAALDLPIDDVTYLSPRHNLGINLFDVTAETEEDVIAATDLLEYVIGGLMDAELTSKQQPIFQYGIQLLIRMPHATISTFRQLLRHHWRKGYEEYRPHIERLTPTVREFFEHEFGSKDYDTTKEEVLRRLASMMMNPTFARIFQAPTNPVDMFREMQDRRLILIDTDVTGLGDAASAFFGRLFIAQILRASRRRFEGRHKPVYLYIDEAPAYFDSRLQLMLHQARKANIGVILAHQDLQQAREKGIHAALMGNTATKFAAKLGDSDARAMASEMRTTAEFIHAQPPHHFAARMGDQVYSIAGKADVVERARQRRDHNELIAEMERRYGYTAPPPAEPPSEDEAEPPEDIPQEEEYPSEEL